MKFMLVPVLDLHTGFPYSAEDQFREYVGPRNVDRFPRFVSLDLQVLREISLPGHGKRRKAKVGFGVFNILNHFDPRDVQANLDSYRFGTFFNSLSLGSEESSSWDFRKAHGTHKTVSDSRRG